MSHHLRKLKPLERSLLAELIAQVADLQAENARLREALDKVPWAFLLVHGFSPESLGITVETVPVEQARVAMEVSEDGTEPSE